MKRVAAIQMTSTVDVSENLAEADRLIAEAAAAGAALAVLPENFALMAGSRDGLLGAAEPFGQGPIQGALARAARSSGIWVVGGTVPLRSDGDRLRAACLVYDDRGQPVGRYDKMHLFDVGLRGGEAHSESRTYEPGREVVVVDTPVGRVGLSVCYDLRFPELYRALLDAGAHLFAVPSAFTAFTGRAHWEPLLRARAIENLVYVVAAAQTGHHANGRETHGHSMVVDPWGAVVAEQGEGRGVVTADIDLSRIEDVRAQLPSVEHRRL